MIYPWSVSQYSYLWSTMSFADHSPVAVSVRFHVEQASDEIFSVGMNISDLNQHLVSNEHIHINHQSSPIPILQTSTEKSLWQTFARHKKKQ